MTFKELCEAIGKAGKLPKVRYRGPKDRHIQEGAEGQIVAVKDQDGDKFRGCAAVFRNDHEKTYPIWFHDSLYDLDRRSHYITHLEIIPE